MIHVCLVDGYVLMREGVKKILADSKNINVVDEASTGKELIDKLSNNVWDVLILAIALPDRSGLDLIKEIKKKQPTLPILVLSFYDEDQYGYRAFKSGASGFLNKNASPVLLKKAICKLAKGGKYISSDLAEKLTVYLGSQKYEYSYNILSDREFEVVKMIGFGKSSKEIALKLGISNKTVSTYRARIKLKLNLDNNAEIIKYCIEHQLFD